ncbi:MAG TPA: hypothetical protein VHP11_04375 [Tepidisphaeraceae bacterium]|nr:hypothetical protein [Tepidisphaeraceae bacterium]
MTRHWATMLLIGVGFVPDRPAAGVDQAPLHIPASPPIMQRMIPSALMRRAAFDHLKSAGRYKREQIATLAYDDGRLWAEWSGHVEASEMRRVETTELDAEWMAYSPRGEGGVDRWMVARRDLQPWTDGQFWSVMVYGQPQKPGILQLIATMDSPPAAQGMGTYCEHFVQGPESVRLTLYQRSDGTRRPAVEYVAADLRRLEEDYPEIVRRQLWPAIQKVGNVKVG